MDELVSTSLFPQGHATGAAFCNRNEERKQLKSYIKHHEHCVLMAPRRYGKSSLIKQVLLESHVLHKRVDLLPATNMAFVQKSIKHCVSEIINEIAPKTKKAKQALLEFVHQYHPKLTVRLLGQSFEIATTQTPEVDIQELLLSLNQVAKRVNQHIVLCFDEFQQISFLKDSHAIEASIRHAVEESTHVTYLFSGSIRHLLQQMFRSKSRPLYHLCEMMEIDRIKQTSYLPILTHRAAERWGTMPDKRVIIEILNLTKCHPYYVNALCRQLWKLNRLPDAHHVQQCWFSYVESQLHWITDDLAKLTPNQRVVLAALANQPEKEVLGKAFVGFTTLNPSSISRAIDFLVEKDLIYQANNQKYYVLDPAIESYLLQIEFF